MQPRLTNCHVPSRTNAPPLWGVVDYWTVLSTLVQFIHEVITKSAFDKVTFLLPLLSSLLKLPGCGTYQ